MANKPYSTVDRLSAKARGATGVTSGATILSVIILLSGVLSAIFFWSFSQRVFAGVWQPVALMLGLFTGLLPAEGAFFGWKAIRNSKANMTQSQVNLTEWGVGTSIACSVFSTFSLFVAQFPAVPPVVSQYTDWFVFLALSLPIIVQMIIIAKFEVNERDTVENFEQAKLSAMGFDAWVRHEQARIAAIIEGMDNALDTRLESYGGIVGRNEADKMLSDGSRELRDIAQGHGASRQTNGSAPQRTAATTPPLPTETAVQWQLDDLLKSVGKTRSEAKVMLQQYGLDKDAAKAYGTMKRFGYVPDGMSEADFTRLHGELTEGADPLP